MSAILLSDGTDTISLSGDLQWVDELGYDPKTAMRQFAVDGSQHIDLWTAQAGRPITLAPSQPTYGDMTRETFEALREWCDADPEKTFTLTFPKGDSHSVVFDHPGIVELGPSYGDSIRDGQEWWRGTLKFITV